MSKLKDKVAIVTGGASGIGEAIVREFGVEGAQVISADVTDVDGQQIVDEVCAAGGDAVFTHTDVSQVRDIQALIADTLERFGRLDVFVANAGIQIEKTLTETTEDEFDRLMSVNQRGAFFCCKHAVEAMLKNGAAGGSIVVMGSALSHVAEPELAAYCTAKGGLHMLVKSIACDYGDKNIRANCICPGYINTPLCDAYFETQPDPAAARQEAGAMHCLNRMGTTSEVAKCAVFLAGDDSSFVTGSSLVVDGGLIAKV